MIEDKQSHTLNKTQPDHLNPNSQIEVIASEMID